MQKIINVLAVASAAVSVAVVGSGLYIYVNRASIIDGIKSQAIEAVLGGGGLPGGLGGGSSLPIGTPDLAPPANQAATPDVGGAAGFGVQQF
tara:strand:+ start:110 stop:385 length:276 start_codon:yes stop_codon:yes gene_type:complete